MSARSEEDLKKEWKAQIGEEKGDYYHHFWHQLHRLHLVWSELRTIIRQGKEGKKLLSDTIPLFCLVATDSMWKELIVGLCGFSDPCPKERKKPEPWKRPLLWLCGYSRLYAAERTKSNSFSFPCWLSDHTGNLVEHQKQELKDVINTYKSTLSPIRYARNNYLGHWNADALLWLEAKPIQQEFIERTMKDIEAVLKVIERQNRLTPSEMGDGPVPLGGAEDLLMYLRTAQDKIVEEDRKRADELEKHRMERAKRRSGGD
ncbi:MAG: hypothetical protein ACOH13_12635 [Flavobacteriales bacterium]